jgi:hypothetical protein
MPEVMRVPLEELVLQVGGGVADRLLLTATGDGGLLDLDFEIRIRDGPSCP